MFSDPSSLYVQPIVLTISIFNFDGEIIFPVVYSLLESSSYILHF